MTLQNSAFDAEAAFVPVKLKSDLVTLTSSQVNSPMQLEFERLLASVEQMGAELQTMQGLHSQYRAKFGGTFPNRQAEQDALHRQMVMFLHERLQRPEASHVKVLTASNRKAIGRIIVSLSIAQAMQGDVLMRQIHDFYSDESIEDQDEMKLEDMRELLSEMGVELPELGDTANAAEHARAALAAIQERMLKSQAVEDQRQAKRDQKRADRKAEKAKSDPKAQAKLAAQSQAALDAQSSLKNIYRQLASQLHPDRAEDDAQRALHHDLMSEVNAAYDKQDLLALLKLQLKAQQIDANAMHSVAEDKLKAWVALLRAQAKELTGDVQNMRIQIMGEFRLPHGRLITAAALETSYRQAMHEYDDVLHMMRSDLELIKNDAGLKRWAKAQSRLLAQDEALQSSTMDDMSHLNEILDEIMRQQLPTRPAQRSKKKAR